MSGVNSNIRNTQSQLKDVERLLKLDPANTELLSQKQKLLSQAVGETKNKLDTLKTAEAQAEEQFKNGKISQEQYDALKREIIATGQQLKKLEDQAGSANVTLQKIGQAGEHLKGMGEKATAAGQEMSKLSAGIAAVGTASVVAWEKIDEAYDLIAKGTGATGDALKGLQSSFDNVFSSIPTEAETAGTAIADINTRFGFTGEVLEDCTRRFIQFSEVNNADVSTSIANVSRYMGDAGIESSKYGEVLDQLTAASQASGISIDKLSENLTKYGAPLRALGLDTKESIAIFAGWEKAGVNTEIAFSGMKKAIGNWAKEGKDSREEFKKTLKEIESCPDIAAATTKAIEVFGQKAGPDLADAIKGGRFAYEDFLEVLAGSSGQLEQTFNDTLDPIDDVKVAMQSLTSQGAELGAVLLETLAPMITGIVEKLKELTRWFGSLDESQKVTVVKTGLLVAALGPLLIATGQIATGIGGLLKMFSAIGPVFGTLGAAGGPIFLTVAAMTGLVLVLEKMTSATSEYKKEAQDLTDQEVENKTKVDELYESYTQLEQQRSGAIAGIQAETQHEQSLFEELKNITDANGNVKAGYEERARFIVGELSSALGTEIEMTGNQIQKYGELCSSIDQLIVKKQANALLDAEQAAYAEALKNQTDAFMTYNNAQKAVEETKAKLNETQRQEARCQMELNALWAQNAATGVDVTYAASEITDTMFKASEEAAGYSEKLSGLNQTLSEAETAYVAYNTAIANYEGLSAAIVSGDQQKISEAVLMAANNFQTAETATKESLERQVQTLTEKYNAMKAAVDAGAPGITQAQVDQMKALVEQSKTELDRLPEIAKASVGDTTKAISGKSGELSASGKQTGSDFSTGLSSGITSGQEGITGAAGEVAKAGVEATKKALESHSPEKIGFDYDTGFAKGVTDNTGAVVTSVDGVAKAAAKGIEALPDKAGVWGADMMKGFIGGIESKRGALAGTCSSIAQTVSDYLHFTRPEKGPLRNYEEWMPHMMQGLAGGITANKGIVGSAAETAATEIGNGLAAGLLDSVKANKENAKKGAEEIAGAVLSAAKKKLENYKVYHELTLASEAAYWDAARKQTQEGTQARIDADAMYYKSKQDLNSKMQAAEEKYTDNVAKAYENLNKEIQNLNKQYEDAVDSRADKISNAFGLFEQFSSSTTLTSEDLMNNLQSQVDGISEWQSNINNLSRRGIGEALLSDLRELGPQSAAEVKLLTEMTDEELDRYVSLFRQKNRMARKEAVKELAPMQDDIAEQIMGLKQQTTKELADYQQEYIKSLESLGAALNQPVENMKLVMAQNAVEMVSGLALSIQTEAGSTENAGRFKAIADSILNASGNLPNDMEGVGKNAITGIIIGLQSKAGELYSVTQGIVNNITSALEDAFETYSYFENAEKNSMTGYRGGALQYKGMTASAGSAAVSNQSGSSPNVKNATGEVMELLSQYLPSIAKQKYVMMDGKAVVGKTSGGMNSRLGLNRQMSGRSG